MDYRDEFNIITKAQNERLRQQDRDDLNNELRGTNVGRVARFLSPEAREIIQGDRKDKKGLDPLELALLSMNYTEFCNQVMDENRAAQSKVTALQERIANLKEKLDDRLDSMLDQAVTLPDGRKAFIDEDGSVYTEDHQLVDPALVDGIDWEGRPAYKGYVGILKDRETLDQYGQRADEMSLSLGDIANRLEDLKDDPKHRAEVEAIRKEQGILAEDIDNLAETVTQIGEKYDDSREPSQSAPSQFMAAAPKVDGLNF